MSAAVSGRWLALCGLLHALGGQAAQALPAAPAPVQVLALSDADRVRVDGRLDEPFWTAAPMIDVFYETDPGDRLPPQVRTEVRFAIDGGHLYLAIRAFDPDLQALRAPHLRRDESGDDVDKVTVFLDGLGTRRFAQIFEIAASGAIGDGLFSETSGSADQSDTQMGVEDRSPNYRFRSAVSRFDGGWSAELAIPFSSLRYEAASQRPWAVLIARNYPREQAYYFMSGAVPHDATCTLCFAAPLSGVQPPAQALSVQGAATLSQRRSSEQVGQAPPSRERASQAGVDLKVPLRADTHLDVTIQPDFSQVEIDAPQLSGNSRYALYFPEKRQFFLEGADILESPLPVLRTRSLAAPDWGARVTHRGAMEGTALIVRDGPTGDLLLPAAGHTDAVARDRGSTALLARSRLHLDDGALGLLYSERRYDGALGHNAVAGIDAAWHPTGADRFDVQWLHSHSTALQSDRGVPDAGQAWQARWYRRGSVFNVDASVRRIDPGFRADNGFIEQAGVRQTALELTAYQRPWWRASEGAVYFGDRRETALAGKESLLVHHYLGAHLMLPRLTKVAYEPVVLVQQRADTGMAAHTMRRQHVVVSSIPSSWWSGLYLDVQRGPMLDVRSDRVGPGWSVDAWAKWQVLPSLQVQSQRTQQHIRGSAGERLFGEVAQRWLALWHLGPDHYLRWIDQRRHVRRDGAGAGTPADEQEVARTLSWQVRLQGRWLVDSGITWRRSSGDLLDERVRGREVFVKGTFEFEH